MINILQICFVASFMLYAAISGKKQIIPIAMRLEDFKIDQCTLQSIFSDTGHWLGLRESQVLNMHKSARILGYLYFPLYVP